MMNSRSCPPLMILSLLDVARPCATAVPPDTNVCMPCVPQPALFTGGFLSG